MIVFIYEDSLQGLLSAVYDGYYCGYKPESLMVYDNYKPQLMDQTHWVVTDDDHAQRVHKAIVGRLGEDFYRAMIEVFLSEDPQAATVIFKVLQVAFKTSSECLYDLRDPLMLAFKKLRTGVVREQHLMLGLVRFVVLKSNIYYAEIEPKYHQLPLLGDHFSERMAEEYWVIRDLKRHVALFYDKKSWYIRALEGPMDLQVSDEEAVYQNLWKTFHKHVAIEERRNEKLQGSYIPKRYWKHLIEDKT